MDLSNERAVMMHQRHRHVDAAGVRLQNRRPTFGLQQFFGVHASPDFPCYLPTLAARAFPVPVLKRVGARLNTLE